MFYACFIILNFKCRMANALSKYDLRSAVKFENYFWIYEIKKNYQMKCKKQKTEKLNQWAINHHQEWSEGLFEKVNDSFMFLWRYKNRRKSESSKFNFEKPIQNNNWCLQKTQPCFQM